MARLPNMTELPEGVVPNKMMMLPRWLVRLAMTAAVGVAGAVGTWGYWVNDTLWKQQEILIRLQVSVERIERQVCKPMKKRKVRTIKAKPEKTK